MNGSGHGILGEEIKQDDRKKEERPQAFPLVLQPTCTST